MNTQDTSIEARIESLHAQARRNFKQAKAADATRRNAVAELDYCRNVSRRIAAELEQAYKELAQAAEDTA